MDNWTRHIQTFQSLVCKKRDSWMPVEDGMRCKVQKNEIAQKGQLYQMKETSFEEARQKEIAY